jgi:iron-sulfur cluster assembly protein
MINLTQSAADQIAEATKQAGADNMALRIAARVNDAGMLEFGMGFDEERNNDTTVESNGVTLLVNESSASYLTGVTIDFTEVAPGESRFVFMMPNQGGGCGTGGCGGGSCGTGGCSS